MERAGEFYSLTEKVTNLVPYFRWVNRCTEAFGPPSQHFVSAGAPEYLDVEEHHRKLPHPSGLLTILPRLHGIAVDGHIFRHDVTEDPSLLAPPFFHGVKNAANEGLPIDHNCPHLGSAVVVHRDEYVRVAKDTD
eukprot:scaffold68451_cov54-Attheya_sp.AAC.1